MKSSRRGTSVTRYSVRASGSWTGSRGPRTVASYSNFDWDSNETCQHDNSSACEWGGQFDVQIPTP